MFSSTVKWLKPLRVCAIRTGVPRTEIWEKSIFKFYKGNKRRVMKNTIK